MNLKRKESPIFTSQNTFKIILWRTTKIDQNKYLSSKEGHAVVLKEQVKEQVNDKIRELLFVIRGHLSVSELMHLMNLKGRRNFLQNYLVPTMEVGLIEMTQPDSPKSPTQKYKLTDKGFSLKQQLTNKV